MIYTDRPIVSVAPKVYAFYPQGMSASNQWQCFSRDANRKYFVTLDHTTQPSPTYTVVRILYTDDGGYSWQDGVVDSSLTFGPYTYDQIYVMSQVAFDYDRLADKLYIMIHNGTIVYNLDDPIAFTYGEYFFRPEDGTLPPMGDHYVQRSSPIIITVDCSDFTIVDTQWAWYNDGSLENYALQVCNDAVYSFKLNNAKTKHIAFFVGAERGVTTYTIGADTYIVYYYTNSKIRFWTGSLSSIGTTVPVEINPGADPGFILGAYQKWEIRSVVKDTDDIAYLMISYQLNYASVTHPHRICIFDINSGTQLSSIIDIADLGTDGCIGKPVVFTRAGVKYIATYVFIDYSTPSYVWLYDLTHDTIIGNFDIATGIEGGGTTVYPHAGPGDVVYDSSHDTLTVYFFGNPLHVTGNVYYATMDLSSMSGFSDIAPIDVNPRASGGTDGVAIQGGFNNSSTAYKVGIDFPVIYYQDVASEVGYRYLLGDYPVVPTAGKWKTLEV